VGQTVVFPSETERAEESGSSGGAKAVDEADPGGMNGSLGASAGTVSETIAMRPFAPTVLTALLCLQRIYGKR
jgi:hypothetical protein